MQSREHLLYDMVAFPELRVQVCHEVSNDQGGRARYPALVRRFLGGPQELLELQPGYTLPARQ